MVCTKWRVFLVLLVSLTTSFSASLASTDPLDVIAINSLYLSLNSPTLTGWILLGGDPCSEQWQGLRCAASNITSIRLGGLNLGGSLPNDLDLFASIVEIDLSDNHIGGNIPYNLPPTLKSLSLAGNKFDGNIPDALSSLTQLLDLQLNDNHLRGAIPDSFQQLTRLTNLDLSGNNLSGRLPASMGNLSSITAMYLQNNKLIGTLDVLQDLPLKDLNVENNLFSGPIPEKLLSIPDFRKDGNPFNTTVLPSPSDALPPSIAANPPSLDETPPNQGNGPSTETSNSKKLRRSFAATAVVIVVIVLAVVAVMLILCIVVASRWRTRELNASQFNVHKEGAVLESALQEKNIQGKLDKRGRENSQKATPTNFPVEKISALDIPNSSFASRVYTIATLQQYTNSFSEENFVGEGTIGTVYRAELHGGKLLAVKKLRGTVSRQQTDEEFLGFVSSISKIRHTNIVELVGYCNEHGQRLLVYEYFKHGTLHDALHVDDETRKKLSWNRRIQLALEAARALQYLHEICQPPVVHKNFKSANIFLDNKFSTRVADCGLARLKSSGSQTELSVRLLNAYGYGAPELDSGHYTCKSDVYSFGVVMLELLTGRQSYDRSLNLGEQSLARWAVPQLNDIDALSAIVDPSLKGTYPVKSLLRFADIIWKCMQRGPELRPLMSEVVRDLGRM